MENNYLSRAQCSRRNQELSEGENLLHKAAIRAKWDLIDTGQDVSFRAGEIAGIPDTLYEAVEGIVNAALSPHETYLSLKSLFDSDNVLGTVSEAVKQSYIARLDKMDAEFEKAGASGSFKAGLESTKLIADIASLAASGIGVAKGGVALTNLGVKAAKQGIQSTKTVRGLATNAKQGMTATVPKVPSKIAGVSDTLAAANSLSKAGHVAASPSASSFAVLKQPPKLTSIAPSKNSNISQVLPKTRAELYADLKSKGFVPPDKTSAGGYERWVGPNGVKINIKPTGEVIRTQKIWAADKSKKYGERQDYFGNRLPDQSHSTGHFVE
ncbi:hypothetical protein [unidentified bacterial endosymbiont]|uniref:hypothetical protein n=1 Tax=unidentified bacterial endosymbiont TaxID=2355 RepID=UPI00209C8355|nr:hypothetical protein [unidentified bacterial endosymbiont]